jgi:opacity protein-like surface antigen
MKRVLVILTLIALCSTSSLSQVSISGGVGGGLSFSSFPKPSDEFYGSGFGVAGHLDVGFLPFLSGRFAVSYTSFGLSTDKFKTALAQAFTVGGQQANPASIGLEGLTTNIIGLYLSGIGKIPTGSPVTPYGVMGFGLNFISVSDPKISYQGIGDITDPLLQAGIITKGESQTKFGLNFGAGAQFDIGVIALFFEFKYVLIFTTGSSSSHLPLIVGVSFGG